MDDLLALFDENPPEEAPEQLSSSPTTNNQDNRDGSLASRPASSNNLKTAQDKRKEEDVAQEQRLASISSNVDLKVGFRITKRLVSSMDLLDLLASHPFHSPASLSAMSLKQLNTLLTDPAQVIDRTTVSGKTNLLTVGLVFANSGTRISSSGNAFNIVNIGSLRSGPCASVMLFGSVYGKFCKKLTPGTAVAVLYPRLVPPKADYSGDTSVTFSLNDERQLVMLGTALDFGFCQAKTRGKNEQGVWVADARRCRNYVDKTLCLYCQAHRSQATTGGRAATAGHSRMQDLRQQVSLVKVQNSETIRNGRIMTGPTLHVQRTSSRFSNAPAASTELIGAKACSRNRFLNPHQGGHKSSSAKPIVPKGSSSTNGILNPRLQTAKSTLKSAPPSAKPSGATGVSLGGSVTNPYARRSIGSERQTSTNVVTPADTRRSTSTTTTVNKNVNISQLISDGKRKKKTDSGPPSKKTRRKINTSTGGFDGSVAIPKPKVRVTPASIPEYRYPRELRERAPGQQHRKDEAGILERQKALAEKFQEKDGPLASKSLKKSTSNQTKMHSQPTDGWLAPLNDTERERLRNVKSKFATEADAERLAAASNKVLELAKEEERKTKTQSKKNSSEESKQIRKEWRCLTCQQTFKQRPRGCFSSGHQVAVERELRDVTSKEQKRAGMNKKEGGLRLGSGVEWSWTRFSS